jgi:crotonobetainyl-CoA:carnitine CoA-transferase CaiB-like acyl-CoA transferase
MHAARADLFAKREKVGGPAGPINTLEQVFANEQVMHRAMRLLSLAASVYSGAVPRRRTEVCQSQYARRPLASVTMQR